MSEFQEKVARKIVRWIEVPRQWYPVLECGHEPFAYDDGVNDETKKEIGTEMRCGQCEELEKKIKQAEKNLQELKAERKP